MNKTVGILTFFNAINYGALFQTVASFEFLKNNGINVKVINYRCKAVEDQYSFQSVLNATGIKGHALGLIDYILKTSKRSKFRRFQNAFDLTEKCMESNIYEILNELDTVIVGSDQVWNPSCTGADSVYLLNDFDHDYEKFSYAASIGQTEKIKDFKCDIERCLNDFKYVTVREKEASDFITDNLLIANETVLDPVFLPQEGFWESISSNAGKHKPYIFVYNLTNLNVLLQEINAVVNKTGIEVILVSRTTFYDLKALKKLKAKVHIKSSCGPDEFLGFLKGAQYVITDSFHGSALSILMKKQFASVISPEKQNTNSRLVTLMQSTGLNDRIIDTVDNAIFDRTINYGQVFEKLQPQINHSQKVLLKMSADDMQG